MRPSGVFNDSYNKDMAIIRTKTQWGMLIGFLVFLFLFPLFAPPALLSPAITIGITAISVVGLMILVGYAGQISVGQAAFMAVGSYTSAILVTRAGVNFFVALPLAGVSAAAVGMVFGLPSLRIKGFYLAMATLAAHLIILYIASNWSLTGSTWGIDAPRPQLGGLSFDSNRSYYYIVMVLVVVMTFLAKNIVRTRVGRAFIAIRDNDIAAEVMGINIFRYKLLAFGIGCFYAGIAGALRAHYFTFFNTEFSPLMAGIWLLAMVVIGGMGSILGAILGASFLGILGEVVTIMAPKLEGVIPVGAGQVFASLGLMVYAVVIILFLILEPRGLAHRWELFKASYRLHPFSY